MKRFLPLLLLTALTPCLLRGADAPAAATPAPKPKLKITPGQAIVPTDAMRRIWGELISLDLQSRTGKFRKDGTDEVMSFTVLPYSELLHHAAFGDLQDFRVGERAIFRLHENDAGEWVWLTYIQDEMNMMNGHKEYFHVDSIDSAKGVLTCTQGNADLSYVREKDIVIGTDAATRYWKDGQPAKFSDIHVGDQLRTKTHGVGKGKERVCWEVFLDDASLLKFQAEQKAVHAARMAAEGAPAYVDKLENGQLELTLFRESGEYAQALKPGQPISVAVAGMDRKPVSAAVPGQVTSIQGAGGGLTKGTFQLSGAGASLAPGSLVRVWAGPK